MYQIIWVQHLQLKQSHQCMMLLSGAKEQKQVNLSSELLVRSWLSSILIYIYYYTDINYYTTDSPSIPTNINISHKSFDRSSFRVTLKWDLSVERVHVYHVNTSIGLNLLMEASTNATTIEVSNIPYNQQVTVSIVSVNCYSESAKAKFNFAISESLLIIINHLLSNFFLQTAAT